MIVLILVLSAISARATNQPAISGQDLPRAQGFVSDFAGKLSPKIKKKLEAQLREFAARSNIDLAVVTLPFENMHGRPIEEYSLELGRRWGVGRGPDKLGLLLLVAIQTPDKQGLYHGATRLEVSRKLEKDIPNELAGDIIRTMRNDFTIGRFDKAISEGVSLIMSTLSRKRGIPGSKSQRHSQPLSRQEANRIG